MATNVDAKLLKQTKFPPEFSQKVDMKKVNVEVMKKYVIRASIVNTIDHPITLGGLLARSQRYWAVKMML